MNNFSLEKIKEFENFTKDNDYEFVKFKDYLELTKKSQEYEELFFKKYLNGYYKINQFLSLVEENNLTEKTKEYIFKFGELETVISYYLYLFAKKDPYQEEVKTYIIKHLDLKTYINYQFRFQLYLFTTLNNIDFGKYVYLLRENNHCSDNEINLINSKFDSLFCSSKEFSKYNDKTTILNINRKEIEKIIKENNNLFIKNTLLFLRNLVTSSSDITYGSNIALLESYINFNKINLLSLLSEYGASGIISFYKDSNLQITKKPSILSVKYNEVMSIEEKFIFMEKMCEYVNIELTEYKVKKIYLDLLFINEEAGFNLVDNNLYPEINKVMINLFFSSMTKNDYFQGENKIYFKNNIFSKNKNSNYNYGDEDKDEYNIEYILYESEENIYKMQKNSYQNLKEKLYYDLIEVYSNTNKKEAKRIKLLIKNEFENKKTTELEEEKHILKEIIKIDLNEENLSLLEKYAKKNIEIYMLFAELLNNIKNNYLIEKLLDVDLLLLELRTSTEKSDRRNNNYNLFNKLNKLQTIVIFMLKKVIKDKESNNNNIILLLDFLEIDYIDDKELFEIFNNEKDYILSLNVDKIKYLKYYQTHNNLKEEEEIELQNLMFEDFVDSNNYGNINQIINLNERLKSISPIKEFKIRLRFYLNKETKELYKNKYIFELLKNKYYIILSNKDIVEKLIEEKSWSSSGDFEKTTFIKDMIKYNKGMELWNVMQEIGNHFKIKMDSKLKTEFFFTKAEKLEDIF